MYISRAERPIHIERAAERALEPTQRELRHQRESGAREPTRKLTAHVAGPRERACVPLDLHRLRAESDMWAANRMARIVRATAGAFVNRIPTQGAVVCVERRGASELECFVIARGEDTPRRETSREAFWLLPGGDPNDGRGWRGDDSLDLDLSRPRMLQAARSGEGGGE